MHFRQSSAQNRSKGQHMQKAEMSIPRIAPVKKAVKAETVTLRHLAMALADNNGLPKAKVNAMLMGMVGDMGRYTQFQVAQSMPIAAANEGGGAAFYQRRKRWWAAQSHDFRERLRAPA